MDKAYIPSVAEVLVSLGLTAGMIFAYRVMVTVFPVFTRETSSRRVSSTTVQETANAK
jgi:Ni/Fe-hydrogenase subunit HybB-like protein